MFSQLLLLVALLLGQHQSWAENNCQHLIEQATNAVVIDHAQMNHASMGHTNMNHDMNDMTPEDNSCCDECACEYSSCHSQSVTIADSKDWTFESPNNLNKLSKHWQLSQNTSPLLRPPSLT